MSRADQAEVVAALRRPEFYSHAPEAVEVRETPISWVFLAGDRVLKVKKPVVLPFLDYGTLSRRRALCREEVRLNRRLAPDTYLGVRSIVRERGRLGLADGERDHAVEYAVEMRRLPEDLTLAARVRSGEASRDDVLRVARALADFHRRGEPVPTGGAGDVKRLLDDTFATLLAGEPAVARADVWALVGFADAFLAGHDGVLAERGRERVRDGHGDLRAEHVVVEADRVEVFDCLEFDPALRRLDVGADLAFLAMDLERLGRRDLAIALVDGYRSAGGDPGDDALVAFYGAYWACVRAKVAAPSGGPEPQRLIDLGLRLAWRARGRPAVVVCGVAASGKTRLAELASRRWGAVHLSSDVVRKRMAGLAPTERAPESLYGEEATRRTYAELGRLAAEAQAAGESVVVDATFRAAAGRRGFAQAAGSAGAGAVYVECRAPATVLLDRARARSHRGDDPSDATPEVVERQLDAFEPLDDVPAVRHLVVRTDRSVEAALADLEAMLDARLAGKG